MYGSWCSVRRVIGRSPGLRRLFLGASAMLMGTPNGAVEHPYSLSASAESCRNLLPYTRFGPSAESAGAQKKPARTRRSGNGAGGRAPKSTPWSMRSGAGQLEASGEAHDLVGADHLLPSMQADTLIADKAFDADERVIAPLAAAGKTAVIPPKANRRLPRDYDQYIYQARHLIENFFAKLKQFRAIATPLRQDRAQLPRRHPPDRRAYLAQLRTGPRQLPKGHMNDRKIGCSCLGLPKRLDAIDNGGRRIRSKQILQRNRV